MRGGERVGQSHPPWTFTIGDVVFVFFFLGGAGDEVEIFLRASS